MHSEEASPRMTLTMLMLMLMLMPMLMLCETYSSRTYSQQRRK